MTKEDIKIAEEHIDLAEDLVLNEAVEEESEETKKKLGTAVFSLEKAEANLKDCEKDH